MRFTWIEALCVLTIAAATLQLPVREHGEAVASLPHDAAGKAAVVAANTSVNGLSKAHRSDKP